MTYAGLPVFGGVEYPRPSAVSETPERIGTSVVLAAGGIRGYTTGSRRTVTLTWNKATEETKLGIEAVARERFIDYVHPDGDAFAAEVDSPSCDAIAGTDPQRFSVSVTLRGRELR